MSHSRSLTLTHSHTRTHSISFAHPRTPSNARDCAPHVLPTESRQRRGNSPWKNASKKSNILDKHVFRSHQGSAKVLPVGTCIRAQEGGVRQRWKLALLAQRNLGGEAPARAIVLSCHTPYTTTPPRARPHSPPQPPSQPLSHSPHQPSTRARRADKVTSVVIPLAMAGTTSLLWARGMLNLYTGSGKLEDQ